MYALKANVWFCYIGISYLFIDYIRKIALWTRSFTFLTRYVWQTTITTAITIYYKWSDVVVIWRVISLETWVYC